MALGDGESLHGGELVAPRGVRDLQGTHLLVAADDLAVGVLDGRDVVLAERASHEAQNERALPDAAGAEHDDAVVVALLRHDAQPDRAVLL